MNRFLGKIIKIKYQPVALLLTTLLMAATSLAQQTPAPQPAASSGGNAGTYVAITAVAVLALVIAILAHAVIGAKSVYEQRIKEEKERQSSQAMKVMSLLIGTCLTALAVTAQTAAGAASQTVAAAVNDTIGGMPSTTFYIVISVIVIELAVIIALVNLLKFLTGIQSENVVAAKAAGAPSAITLWWNKFNKSVSIEKENDIDLSHDYDGIRELDNAVPPWWTWTFVACFVFAIVYLWRYHVSETAPLQVQELQIAMQRAEAEKDAYLKTAATKVDENTVVMLDAAGIAAGQTTFQRNCITCHGPNGGGNNVGPNLTDDYWLHKGGIKDIFKSVKYGWVEKGMQSWQGVLSSTEIAQVASYIKSISGTNVAGGKAAQGELYKDEPAATDSANAVKPKADTVAATKK